MVLGRGRIHMVSILVVPGWGKEVGVLLVNYVGLDVVDRSGSI